MNYKNINNQYKIKDSLIGRLFYFDGKKYKIDDILFDRNPKNQTIYKEGKCITILDYYSKQSNYLIKDSNQPLILNIKKGPQNTKLNVFYILFIFQNYVLFLVLMNMNKKISNLWQN